MSQPGDPMRAYHEHTAHSVWRLRADRHSLDFDNQPLPYKIYRGLEPIPLPRLRPPREVPALSALAASASDAVASARIPDLTTLSRLLQFSAGITVHKRYSGGEICFRAHPNTGALYHVDLYLACCELPDLEAGVYHFDPLDFALRQLRAGDWRAALVAASGAEPALARAPIIAASASTY